MRKTISWAALAVALLATASCATTTTETAGKTKPEDQKRQIAALDRAIEKEKDDAALPVLLFERGHAYLEEADSIRDLRVKGGKSTPEGLEFARLLLGALRDFEDVATNFPQSAEAQESLFHLGVIYDHPNLSSFGIALNYYNRTMEKYPGTESARKSRIAIDKIQAYMRDVGEGRHGAP